MLAGGDTDGAMYATRTRAVLPLLTLMAPGLTDASTEVPLICKGLAETRYRPGLSLLSVPAESSRLRNPSGPKTLIRGERPSGETVTVRRPESLALALGSIEAAKAGAEIWAAAGRTAVIRAIEATGVMNRVRKTIPRTSILQYGPRSRVLLVSTGWPTMDAIR